MTDHSASDELTVLKRDMTDDSLYPIGKVMLGPRGELTLTSAGEGFEEPLQNILQAVNSLDEFRIKVPSPPGSEPFSLDAKSVGRDNPDSPSALRDFLEQRYGLVLSNGKEESVEDTVGRAAEAAPDNEPVWYEKDD